MRKGHLKGECLMMMKRLRSKDCDLKFEKVKYTEMVYREQLPNKTEASDITGGKQTKGKKPSWKEKKK